jgi:hypothetical protein
VYWLEPELPTAVVVLNQMAVALWLEPELPMAVVVLNQMAVAPWVEPELPTAVVVQNQMAVAPWVEPELPTAVVVEPELPTAVVVQQSIRNNGKHCYAFFRCFRYWDKYVLPKQIKCSHMKKALCEWQKLAKFFS